MRRLTQIPGAASIISRGPTPAASSWSAEPTSTNAENPPTRQRVTAGGSGLSSSLKIESEYTRSTSPAALRRVGAERRPLTR